MPKTSAPPLVLTLLLVFAATAAAQQKHTEHTLKSSADTTPPAASVADMAWLAGHWVGEALGGVSEEIWAPPRAGAMLGMYRLVREGRAVFYELLTLSEHQGSIRIRLKHFNPDMTGWEEKDRVIEFPLVAKRDGMFFFDGMTFQPKDDALTVWLAIRQKDGSVKEETFTYRRVAAALREP